MHNVLRFFPMQGVLPHFFLRHVECVRALACAFSPYTHFSGGLAVCVCVLVHVLNSFYHDSMISPCRLVENVVFDENGSYHLNSQTF